MADDALLDLDRRLTWDEHETTRKSKDRSLCKDSLQIHFKQKTIETRSSPIINLARKLGGAVLLK
ncbi:hypothetical protein J6590_013574 [Homalodisca vitripennis]|nr:hypothetical protein J6590_013574 [Homalodisca vitripennis]